mgnify:CR=1 FL=1
MGAEVFFGRFVQMGGTCTQAGATVRECIQADDGTRATNDIIPGVAVGKGKATSVVGAATGESSRAIDVCIHGRVFVQAGPSQDPATVRWITCDADGKCIAAILGTHQVLGWLISPITVADDGWAEIFLSPHLAYAS